MEYKAVQHMSWTSEVSRNVSSSTLAANEMLGLFDEDTTDSCWQNFGSCLEGADNELSCTEIASKSSESTGAVVAPKDLRVSGNRAQPRPGRGLKRLKLPKFKKEHRAEEVYASGDEPIAKRTRRKSTTQVGEHIGSSAPLDDPKTSASDNQSRKKKNFSSVKSRKKLYCVCRTPSHGDYVGCDGCNGWFHPHCVGITLKEAEELDKYFCPGCAGSPVTGNTGSLPVTLPNDAPKSELISRGWQQFMR